MKLYSASNGNLLWTNNSLYGFPKFSPDSKKIVTGSSNKVNMIDATTGNILWTSDHVDASNICFSPDGTKIISTSMNGTLRVWNSTNGNMLLDLSHPGMVQSGLYSPDGNYIASFTSSLSTVNLWNSTSGTLVWRINEKTFVNSIEFSPLGSELMYSSMDTIKIVTVSNGSLLWKGDHYSVSNSIYSGDGNKIVSYGLTYPYRLKVWSQTATELKENYTNILPATVVLFQNYPNPFNPRTVISYQIPAAGHVTLKIYAILGREVATLVNEFKPAGKFETIFDGSKLTSGVYIYRITVGNFSSTKKFVLLK